MSGENNLQEPAGIGGNGLQGLLGLVQLQPSLPSHIPDRDPPPARIDRPHRPLPHPRRQLVRLHHAGGDADGGADGEAGVARGAEPWGAEMGARVGGEGEVGRGVEEEEGERGGHGGHCVFGNWCLRVLRYKAAMVGGLGAWWSRRRWTREGHDGRR